MSPKQNNWLLLHSPNRGRDWPGWKTSYFSLVTTSETKEGSALVKNGTEATKARQSSVLTSWENTKLTVKPFKMLRNKMPTWCMITLSQISNFQLKL